MSGNKTHKPALPSGKYLKYAIGEIILVVIGILIALQINNWNIERQDRAKEIETLKELKKGLNEDKIILTNALDLYKQDSVKLQQLYALLELPDHPYTKDLDALFGEVYGIRYNRLNSAFYEDLKSTGLQIINNRELRASIVNLFEQNYDLLTGFLENERSVNQVTRPYYLENFTDIDFQDSATPLDYEKIWTDPYYKNIVHYRIITLEFNQLREYQNTINAIDPIMVKIEHYLDRIK